MKAVLTLLLVFFISINVYTAIDKLEYEELYNAKKYSILLEKSINLLSLNKNSLSNEDTEFLYYYTAIAYIKNKNIDIGKSYLIKIEKEFPKGQYLKNAYQELIKIYDKDKIRKFYYLKKLTSEFPKTREAFDASILLGKQYIKERKFNSAINVFEQIVNEWNMGDINPESYILLTLSYSRTDAYLDALDYLRLAKKKAPKLIRLRAEYLFESSKIYFNTQNYKDSTAGFRRFLNVFPKDKKYSDALLYLSKSLMKEKKYYDASTVMIEGLYKNRSLRNHRSLENKKKYFSLLLNITQSLIKLTEKERSVFKKKYKSFSDIDKNLNEIKNKSINYNERRTATVLLNNKFLRNGDIEGAIKNYFIFLKKKGDPYIRKKFREYLTEYIKGIETDDMGKMLKLWVLVKPRKSYLSGVNLIELAKHLVNIGLIKNGEDIYTHILKYTLYKKFWKISQNQLARIKYEIGEYEEFLKLFDKLSFDSKNKTIEKDEFLYYKLIALQKTDKIQDADKILKDVFVKKISTIHQYKLMKAKADYFIRNKNNTGALELYKNITNTSFAKKNKLVIETKIADLYYLLNQYDKALAEYKRIEQKKINMEWVLFQKTNIYRKKNMKKEAELEIEKLKKLNPESFWLKQLNKNV